VETGEDDGFVSDADASPLGDNTDGSDASALRSKPIIDRGGDKGAALSPSSAVKLDLELFAAKVANKSIEEPVLLLLLLLLLLFVSVSC
jgi:hypothetical protein